MNPTHHAKHNKIHAFSLLEILCVLCIFSIILAIALPNHQDLFIRIRREEGQMALFDLACRMEDYYAHHHTYKTATLATGHTTDVLHSAYTAQGWYKLSINHATDNSYQLTATAQQVQARSDHNCFIMRWDHLSETTHCIAI